MGAPFSIMPPAPLTEAAGIACLYAIFASVVIYRALTLADVFNVSLPKLYRGVLPFVHIYGAALILVTYVPAITLAPPH